MTIFAILAPNENPKIASAVATKFTSNNYQVAPGQWLVSANNLTAKEVSDKLGISDGSSGRAIVLSIGNYYGRHSPDLWEWIKVKLEAPNG